jgi:hypothetical protein
VVRGVTGIELKIRRLRCLRFQLRTRTYEHTCLVARIATQCHGIRALKAVLDVGQSRTWIGKENYCLTIYESYEEGDDFLGKIEQGSKTAKTVGS